MSAGCRRASRHVQDNLGRHVHVAGLVGVDGKCDDRVLCGLRPRMMIGSASCVKLAHKNHCAWQRSPAPCSKAPFTGPFSSDHQNMFLHLCCPLPRQLQQILEPRAALLKIGKLTGRGSCGRSSA